MYPMVGLTILFDKYRIERFTYKVILISGLESPQIP